jgi:hypothetical protein
MRDWERIFNENAILDLANPESIVDGKRRLVHVSTGEGLCVTATGGGGNILYMG